MPVAVRPSKLPRRKSPVNQWASSTSSGCRCEGTRAEFRAAKLQLLGSFANFIVPDLGLTNTEFGLLTGLFFIVFYSAMGLFMGALADMVNRTRLIAAGLALWSALTALSGAARGFWTLAAPRMLIGVGESIMTPTSMSLLSDRFPTSKLGFASGFYYMGVPIGIGITLGGVVIDALMARGVAEPYTWTLLAFTIISLGAAPLYYWAGRRYQADRQHLLEMAA